MALMSLPAPLSAPQKGPKLSLYEQEMQLSVLCASLPQTRIYSALRKSNFAHETTLQHKQSVYRFVFNFEVKKKIHNYQYECMKNYDCYRPK